MNIKLFAIMCVLMLTALSCSGKKSAQGADSPELPTLPRGVQELATMHPPASAEGQIEVIEFLWLGCPHCREFHSSWVSLKKQFGDQVFFRSVPATPSDWAFDARVYLALEELDLLDDGLLANYFEVRQGPEAQSFATQPTRVAQWLNQRYGAGIAEQDFASMLESSLVNNRFQDAETLWKGYQLRGVPAFLITQPQSGKTYLVKFTQPASTKQRITELLEALQKK